MTNITPNLVDIIYGDLNITSMFNLMGITAIPDTSPFNLRYEALPSGAVRKIYERNTDNVFTITLDRSSAKIEHLNTLREAKNGGKEAKLTIFNKNTGDIIWECDSAIINTNKGFPSGIADNQGNDFEVTFNVYSGE